MNETQKMLNGLPYLAWLDGLEEARTACRVALAAYNTMGPWNRPEMDRQIRLILGSAGKNILVNQPFYCDYGTNITVGDNFFANFGVTILDVAPVHIGSNVLFGPHVALYTAGHPMHPAGRASGYEWGVGITIGNDVWLGGNVIVNPGVTIGKNVVAGAGAVITKDIPDNVFCAGNPARIIRKITDEDRNYYRKDLEWPEYTNSRFEP